VWKYFGRILIDSWNFALETGTLAPLTELLSYAYWKRKIKIRG